MTAARHCHLRAIGRDDASVLEEMLYQAIYVPPGEAAPQREVVALPELSRYIEAWGRAGDMGLVAIDARDGRPLGAAWLRLLAGAARGFGHVDDTTPELSIAVMPMDRGQGIGTRLLDALIAQARGHYPAISLSVDGRNPAVRLYRRSGFVVVRTEGPSIVMRLALEKGPGDV